MDTAKISSVKTSRFTEFFIQANGLGQSGFDEWLLLPGMLFQAPDKWWGNRSKRHKPRKADVHPGSKHRS